MTYTIVARDPMDSTIGLATASHSFNVAAKTVAWQRTTSTDVLLASQAFSSRLLGQACIDDIAAGGSIASVGRTWLEQDPGRALRQVILVTSSGCSIYTGGACPDVADHVIDSDSAAAGNTLASRHVLTRMHATFLDLRQSGTPLPDCLLGALNVGHQTGGDYRGDRSAALVIIGGTRTVDLRVEDHGSPVEELRRLYRRWRADQALVEGYAWILDGCPTDRGTEVSGKLAQLRAELVPDADAWRTAFGAQTPEAVENRAARFAAALRKACRATRNPASFDGRWSRA